MKPCPWVADILGVEAKVSDVFICLCVLGRLVVREGMREAGNGWKALPPGAEGDRVARVGKCLLGPQFLP